MYCVVVSWCRRVCRRQGALAPLGRCETAVRQPKDPIAGSRKPRLRVGRVPILLLRASDRARSPDPDAGDATLGWSEFTTERVVVRFVPGTHESLLEPPHVSVLAEELDRILDEAMQQT